MTFIKINNPKSHFSCEFFFNYPDFSKINILKKHYWNLCVNFKLIPLSCVKKISHRNPSCVINLQFQRKLKFKSKGEMSTMKIWKLREKIQLANKSLPERKSQNRVLVNIMPFATYYFSYYQVPNDPFCFGLSEQLTCQGRQLNISFQFIIIVKQCLKTTKWFDLSCDSIFITLCGRNVHS